MSRGDIPRLLRWKLPWLFRQRFSFFGGEKNVVRRCPEFTLRLMTRGIGLIGIVIVAATGAYFYLGQIREIAPDGKTPQTMVSVIGVQNDLLAMANAEKRYQVTNSKYASLDELRTNSDIAVPSRKDILYSVDASGSHFRITATYTGPDPKAPKHLSIDDTLTVTKE
jgi:hypothetical protein